MLVFDIPFADWRLDIRSVTTRGELAVFPLVSFAGAQVTVLCHALREVRSGWAATNHGRHLSFLDPAARPSPDEFEQRRCAPSSPNVA